jgi:hypothetical protein
MDMKSVDKLSPTFIKYDMDRIFVDPAKDVTRSLLEMSWFRNILYYLGEQWLSWFEETQTFGRRYSLSGTIPTPVSNIIRDYVRSTKALVLNKRYTVRVWPNSSERADIEGADLAGDALRWMDSLDDYAIEDAKEWVVIWMLLTGSGFARIFPEVDDGVYMISKDGKGLSKGKVACEPLLPFNVIVPTLGTKLEQKAYLGLKSLKPKEWVEDTFKILLDESDDQRRMVEYESQLMKLIANVSPWKMRGMQTDLDDNVDKYVMYKEIEYRPTQEFPKGRYVAMAGDQIVKREDSMPVPVDKNGLWDYSVVHFQYNYTPGSFWPTSGVDDLISPQNTINEIDQALVINRKSLGRPMVLTPAQLTMRRLSAKGQSLLAVEYDGRNAGGGHPQIASGTPYPEQVLKEREMQKGVAQDAGGDPKNILRGQAPTSGASGIMVDSLREAAEASHAPDIARFYRKWAKVQRLRLTVAQALFTETRILKIPGEGNQIKVRAFKGADFRSNTDVRLELDSAMSSTQAGKNEMMMKLLGMGFFGDIAMQPKLRREVGKKMGLGTLPDEENLHQDKAEMENSIFAFGSEEDIKMVALPNAPIPDPETGMPIVDDRTGEIFSLFPKSYDPTFRFDNHAVHAKVLIEFILSKEFPKLSKERQSWARAHLDLHQAAMAAIEEENTAKMAEKAALGITEPGGGGAPPAAPVPTVAGPAGMMPEGMQMQGQEGGMKPSNTNY